jgi:hypothetical protein
LTWVLAAIALPIIFALALVWFVRKVTLFIARVLGQLVGAWARAGRT